ncbi:MAG: PaaI family thioesterase [Bacteriovoracaceae bacterium]|nr:PaaI family thioesterase [Bacteroidota bacterium]
MDTVFELFENEMSQMHRQFPNAQIQPNCFTWMNVSVRHYESRTSLTIDIPVAEEMLNPMRVMQGGFITAAFDNAFGPLSYVAARNPCTTLDLHTQYIRPIAVGDRLTVSVRVVSRGPVSIHLSGEAHNSKGKLVATCTSNMIVMK